MRGLPPTRLQFYAVEKQLEQKHRTDPIMEQKLQASALRRNGDAQAYASFRTPKPLARCPQCGAKKKGRQKHCPECGTRFETGMF